MEREKQGMDNFKFISTPSQIIVFYSANQNCENVCLAIALLPSLCCPETRGERSLPQVRAQPAEKRDAIELNDDHFLVQAPRSAASAVIHQFPRNSLFALLALGSSLSSQAWPKIKAAGLGSYDQLVPLSISTRLALHDDDKQHGSYATDAAAKSSAPTKSVTVLCFPSEYVGAESLHQAWFEPAPRRAADISLRSTC
jgi:hypothetical protein